MNIARIAFALALPLTLVLSGCGKSGATASAPTPAKLSMQQGRELTAQERKLLEDPRVAKAILGDAAREDDADTLRALARYGVDVDQPLGEGRTALDIAAYRRSGKAVAALLELHADPNGKGELTPLMHAAFVGDEAIVTALVDAGATVDRSTTYGQTPLMFAALFGRRETYDALVRLGADENAVDRAGNTPKALKAYANNAEAAETFLRNASQKLAGLAKRASQ